MLETLPYNIGKGSMLALSKKFGSFGLFIKFLKLFMLMSNPFVVLKLY